MEQNKIIKEFMQEVEKPIVPNEIRSNSMTTTKPFSIFFRPNNYRKQIVVKEKTNSIIKNIRIAHTTIETPKFGYNSHSKLISIKHYHPNITIQYGKNTLTAIYSQNIIGGHKEIYLLEGNTQQIIQDRISQIKDQIEEKIDKALYEFIDRFNLSVPKSKPIWARYEDFIKGEDYIDKIPREVIIHDTYFKKVYGEGLEFKSSKKGETPTVHMKQYLKNRAIEKVDKEIAYELSANRELIKGILDINASSAKLFNQLAKSQSDLKQSTLLEIQNKKLHMNVLYDMKKTMKSIREELTQRRIGDFSNG